MEQLMLPVCVIVWNMYMYVVQPLTVGCNTNREKINLKGISWIMYLMYLINRYIDQYTGQYVG